MSKLLVLLNKRVINIAMIAISLLMIAIGLILASSLFFADNVLEIAYKKTEISNKMNGYSLYYALSNQNGAEIYLDIVGIKKYKNSNYEITITKTNVDGKETILEDYVYYLIDGIPYSKDDKNKYHRLKEEVIYINTEIYLKGLTNAKEIVYVGKEEIEDNKYEKYTFVIDNKIMNEILKYSNMPDLVFDKENIECVAWIDNEGYLYRLDYDIATGLDEPTSLMMRIFVVAYNKIEDFR